MFKWVRKSDSAGLGSILFAISQFFTAESVTSSPHFQRILTAIPSQASWAIAGFLLAAWLFPAWAGDEPRWRQLWRWVNGEFRLENLNCVIRIVDQKEYAAVRVDIRTGRAIKSSQLSLRIFSCVGRRIPEEVIVLRELERVPKGSLLKLTLARHLLPKPGEYVSSAGAWGDDGSDLTKQPCLIGRSENLAILELPGRFAMQKHALRIHHATPRNDDYNPVLFAVSEEQGIFDQP